ncbi:MAG: DUF348 domain-containing protein [Chloroflexi bacterium]|nr:DUF348 domain-containing protein [Chloroflexota bacterium]
MSPSPDRPDWRAWTFALLALLASAWKLVVLAGVAASLVALGMLYAASGRTVQVRLDGHTYAWRTHRSSPEAVLAELPLTVREADRIVLPSAEGLLAGQPMILDLARRVRIRHDGTVTVVDTQAETMGEILTEAGIVLSAQDCILVDDRCASSEQPLPVQPAKDGLAEAITAWRGPFDVSLRRARQITVVDGAQATGPYTTAATVGEALAELGVRLYEGDLVYPDLGSGIAQGTRITIARSLPVVLEADGVAQLMRTRANTVAELLVEAGVQLAGEDYADPLPEARLISDMRVQVVRVYDEYYVEEVPVPYETRWEPNNELEIDQQQIVQWGSEGARRRQVRVHYENGQEAHRSEEEEWIAREPTDRIIEYGTGIVLREVETPNGTLTYWRKIRMLATSYSAATAGVPRSASYYGRTRLGWEARFGIVAVDPRVVRLESNLYVPGYGAAVAGDTGGGIIGRRVDLCYDDHNLVDWYKWIDVYLLAPAPPASQINWILPNTPRERE